MRTPHANLSSHSNPAPAPTRARALLAAARVRLADADCATNSPETRYDTARTALLQCGAALARLGATEREPDEAAALMNLRQSLGLDFDTLAPIRLWPARRYEPAAPPTPVEVDALLRLAKRALFVAQVRTDSA